MRGYNLSTRPREIEQHELRHLVEDVRQLAEKLNGGKKSVLVGHGPLVFGIVVLVVGVALTASVFYEKGDVTAPSSERADGRQAHLPAAQ